MRDGGSAIAIRRVPLLIGTMKPWLSGWAVVMVAGCAPGVSSIPEATPSMAARSGVPWESLKRGRMVYLSQCGRCHELVPPAGVKTEDWHLVMPGMCWNAGLTQADEALVTRYVLATKLP